MHTSLLRALTLAGACACSLACLSASAADPPVKADQTFMTKAAGGGIYEVEVSKMAAAKAKSPDVKAYAEMLVKDHTAANGELKQLASSKGVTLPSDMPADKKAKLDRLSASKDLDRDFVKEVGLNDHKTDIALFEKASKDARDADVKSWFGKTLPTLKEHRTAAEQLSHGDKMSMKH
jgi:putative membrane protein